MIVKNIQQILSESNYDLHAVLQEGYLLMQTLKGYDLVFCVSNSLDLKIYSNHMQFNENHDNYVYLIPLKCIAQVGSNHHQNADIHSFHIHVS